MAAWSEQIVAQAGGTLDSVFVHVPQGFAATLTEAEAVNLAAHPDILDVEQDQRVELDD
ncbi:protease inhibitor I9 family protein [Actinoplanes sp. CA-142083]|uniref:protease inhibitor I9 family protein n=1 Tax=Actinoplanes sp. CA-142083 TaxID=3239903 RepID=UPI003D906776